MLRLPHRQNHHCAASILLMPVLALGALAVASAAPIPNYEGWTITVTGLEVTTASHHFDLGYTVDDQCTITRRGKSKYIVTHDPNQGDGIDSYSTECVSASTEVSVSGQGKAVFQPPAGTRTWTYRIGPGEYNKKKDSFSPSSGGKPRVSPDEPMFLPRSIMVSSYLPEADWSVTPEDCGSMAGAKEAAILAWNAAEEGENPPLRFDFPHRLDAEHLTASASRQFDWKQELVEGVSSKAHIEVTYNVVLAPASQQRPPPAVEIEEVEQDWLPEDGNTITLTMRVNGNKEADAFRFTLYDVSKEPGLCGNSQDANTNPDLAFTPGQDGWAIANGSATRAEEGKEAEIEITCHDWGAWGKVKGEAKIDGAWKPAEVRASGLAYVRLPYDDDDDHIADAWQEEKGVGDRQAADDAGKRPTDQANDGDGLSIYEDYRGFYVLGPEGKQHARLDPTRKALFVVDNSGYFNAELWSGASGISAYLLSADMCREGKTPEAARVVNFRSEYAKNGDKYGLVITVIAEAKTDEDGDMPAGLCEDDGSGPVSPKHVTGVYLYPGNTDSLIGAAITDLGIAVAQPDSPQAKAWDKLGLPKWMWQRALDRLMNETYRKQLVDQMMRQTAVHELGHACGLWGHFKAGDPARQETFGLGDKSCPMYYGEGAENQRYLILQVLLSPDATASATAGEFCKNEINCWHDLNVKDE